MGRTCRGPPRAARLSAACPRRRANYSNASAGGDQVEQTRPLGFPLLSRYPRARRSCPPRRAVSWKSRERAEAARAGAGLSSAPSPRVGKPSVICCEEQRGAAGKREGVMDRAGWRQSGGVGGRERQESLGRGWRWREEGCCCCRESKGRLEAEAVGCRGEGRDGEADDGPSFLSVRLAASFQLLKVFEFLIYTEQHWDDLFSSQLGVSL